MPVSTGPGGPSQTWLNEGPTGPMPIEQVQSMVAKARDVDWVPTVPKRPIGLDVGGGGLEASLFNTLNMIARGRTGGGTGGGSQTFEGGMAANKLIALNPFLSKNVTSFAQGGTLPSQYHPYSVLSRNTYDDGGVLPEYNHGGMYERAANQAIAKNQLSGLVANVMNRRMPIAAHGMKTPKYNKGGSTHTMPDGTVHPGATHEEYMAMMAGQYSPTAAPMANKGMKMRKRYTNGGRF